MATRVGLIGGTFDPVHYGHLAAAAGARHLCDLSRVWFVPAGKPPHKHCEQVTPARHRLAMVRLATAGNPAFGVLPVEIERPGPSYTVETVRLLARQHPDWVLHFILGADSLLDLPTWREHQALVAACRLVAVRRPGVAAPSRADLAARLGSQLAERIRIIDTPGVAVAAQELRRLAAAGYPLRYLVPDAVAAYIEEHGLYRTATQQI